MLKKMIILLSLGVTMTNNMFAAVNPTEAGHGGIGTYNFAPGHSPSWITGVENNTGGLVVLKPDWTGGDKLGVWIDSGQFGCDQAIMTNSSCIPVGLLPNQKIKFRQWSITPKFHNNGTGEIQVWASSSTGLNYRFGINLQSTPSTLYINNQKMISQPDAPQDGGFDLILDEDARGKIFMKVRRYESLEVLPLTIPGVPQ